MRLPCQASGLCGAIASVQHSCGEDRLRLRTHQPAPRPISVNAGLNVELRIPLPLNNRQIGLDRGFISEKLGHIVRHVRDPAVRGHKPAVHLVDAENDASSALRTKLIKLRLECLPHQTTTSHPHSRRITACFNLAQESACHAGTVQDDIHISTCISDCWASPQCCGTGSHAWQRRERPGEHAAFRRGRHQK